MNNLQESDNSNSSLLLQVNEDMNVTDFSNSGSKSSKIANSTDFITKSQSKSSQQNQKYQRLKHLLDQASVYSNFLSSKFIKNQQQQQQLESDESSKKQERTYVSQPAILTGGVMKPYQLEGLEWLVSLYENGLNGILADEMGLGKTMQCISFLAFLREKGVYGPFLIAAPLSTLSNWNTELKRFAPGLPCLVYHGNRIERENLRGLHFGSKKGRCKILNPETFPIIITSYEIIMNDKSYLDDFKWKFIIVDEGHRIKNLNCKLIKTLKGFESANRLLLTGTPLQNNLAELWSLLNFLLPDIFDDLEVFQRWFDESELIDEQREECVNVNSSAPSKDDSRMSIISNLHNILKPFLLRRLKTEVEKDLPPKKEYIVYCAMSPLQRQYYTAALSHQLPQFVTSQIEANEQQSIKKSKIVRETSSFDFEGKKRVKKARFNTGNLLNVNVYGLDDLDDDIDDEEFLEKLEKEADHTFDHHDEDDSRFLSKKPSEIAASRAQNQQKLNNIFMQLRKVCNHPYLFFYPYDCKNDMLKSDQRLISNCGKMEILNQLLPELIRRQHRTLIFFQMTAMMDIFEDFLNFKGISYCRFDGSTPQPDREVEINKFREDASIPIFLLSTRAAGLGINLVVADTVIFYDSDWNPQMDLQAQDRAHRIGQTKPVIIYRLVTGNSIESKILERASSKRKLEKVVIHKSKFKGIKQLAGRNADSTIEAEDLKRILTEESAKVIRHGLEGEKDSGSSNSSSSSLIKVNKFTQKELNLLMDRSNSVFSQDAPELLSDLVKVAKPISDDLNHALAGM